MIAPARTAAFHALRSLDAGRQDLPTVLVETRSRLHDERDRALAHDIVLGTLRWRRMLRHVIGAAASRDLTRIEPDVLTVLDLTVYQILRLERVPAAAAVKDGVDLVRHARKSGAAGFANAVLRAIVRTRHRLPLPPRPVDPVDEPAALAYLGITCSHPDWLVRRWLSRLGFDDTERWVRFNNQTPPVTLRANLLKGTRDAIAQRLAQDGIETTPARFAPAGLAVSRGNPWRRPADGLAMVQDEASQLVVTAVGVVRGDRVLDLCASPGGKTLAMAADMADTGLIASCDVRPPRLALLADAVRESGVTAVRIVRVSERGDPPFRDLFDRVLVDAPCSGLGTLRRDPDVKWTRVEEDLRRLSDVQGALLSKAAAVVRPGGRLVYATCSTEPEENEQVVERFLVAQPAFEPIDLRRDLAARSLGELLDERGCLRTRPWPHALEGFYAAALRRVA